MWRSVGFPTQKDGSSNPKTDAVITIGVFYALRP
jgi:hypothetical protein